MEETCEYVIESWGRDISLFQLEGELRPGIGSVCSVGREEHEGTHRLVADLNRRGVNNGSTSSFDKNALGNGSGGSGDDSYNRGAVLLREARVLFCLRQKGDR
jgi:hypothetical protein